ncbi:uracil-DNA glycosylase family protein [Pelomicrobium sp.]|jgi:uracil-DNA glycosylase|uniref:uracil-DNA glycosylase family protein n=1 Tax=Pelomicrobium sp. TaxID=2815319 RepID=UPI002FDD68A1
MDSTLLALRRHQRRLAQCTRCPKMIGPPVMGYPVISPVMLVGQAPGAKEIERHRPFAWTAGKTLFSWFRAIGLDEEAFRHHVYMTAVCHCFPGKNAGGGDRVPDRQEVENCTAWLAAEFQLLRPRLVIPAGKLAIGLFLPVDKLEVLVGRIHKVRLFGFETDVVPLPHPSGASPWHRTEPGRTLLQNALACIAAHPAWAEVCTKAALGQ